MREIKFRAWDKERQIMGEPFTLEDMSYDFDDSYFIPGENGVDPTRNSIVMQFTGLKDKNGVEIYEGDIVKGIVKFPQLLTGDNDDNCNFKMTGSVFYDHHGFSLKCIESMCDEDRDGMVNYFDFIGYGGEIFDEIEIIGNIYQNPELLNNK